MKKLLTLGLALASLTLLAGCGNTEVAEEEVVAPVVEETVVETPVVEEAPVMVETTGAAEEVVAPVEPTAEAATGN